MNKVAIGMAMPCVIVIPILLICQSELDAAELQVPLRYPTIQSAIDDAVGGDTVLIAPGVYKGDGNRDIEFRGKAITVKSEAGPEVTVLDAEGAFGDWHRHFNFRENETAESVVEGLTLVGGWPQGSGGAIKIGDAVSGGASPTIRGNILRGNKTQRGAGIHIDATRGNAQPLIEHNIFEDNETRGYTVENDPFDGCGSAGAIFGYKCAAVIRKNVFRHNRSRSHAGAIDMWLGAPVIEGNWFENNNSDPEGHGMGMGGAILLQGCFSTLHSNVFCGNQADQGGAIAFRNLASLNTGTIANNTLVSNLVRQSRAGGAIYAQSMTDVNVANCIFWNNHDGSGAGSEILESTLGSVLVSYSIVEGGWQAGTNVQSDDPQFVNGGSNNFNLRRASPAIDVGHGTYAPAQDFAGKPRVDARHVASSGVGSPAYTDIGAYEWHGALLATVQSWSELSTNGSEFSDVPDKPMPIGRLAAGCSLASNTGLVWWLVLHGLLAPAAWRSALRKEQARGS